MKRSLDLQPETRAALAALGALVAAGRRERGWTVAELADRLGCSPGTVGRVESGSPGTSVGTVLEAAVLCGVPLFGAEPESLAGLARHASDRLALLPARVRAVRPHEIPHDF